jgi:hypothetical protein
MGASYRPAGAVSSKLSRGGTKRRALGLTVMIRTRQLPLPGSPEARDLGCTCPQSPPAAKARPPIDNDCPVHGIAAMGRDIDVAERGPVDTEGDIVDAATEPELRRT